MAFLLDTCALSDYLQGDLATVSRLKRELPRDVFISAMTRFEIEYGLQLKPNLSKKIAPQLEALYGKISTIDFSVREAKESAEIRSALKKIGQPISFYDLLIAGTAIAHNLILVTGNIKEFSQVKGLSVENWR